MNPLEEALARQLHLLRPDLSPKSAGPKVPKVTYWVEQPDVGGEHSDGVVRKVHLVFKKGTSDKEYIVTVVRETIPCYGVVHNVCFEYGRRGGTHQKGTKVTGASLVKANEVANDLINEKKRKGYKVI